jgi:hypothetical protein
VRHIRPGHRRPREASGPRRHHPGPHLGHRPGPHRGWPAARRTGPSPWLLLLLVPVAAGAVSALVTAVLGLLALGVAIVLVGALPALALGTLALVGVRRRRRRALRRDSASGPARPAAPPRPDLVWSRAHARFHALRAAYAEFECDPMAVLRLPALADVSVASTGRFVDAFAEAQALETDAFPPGGHGAAFVAAVDRAERAWQAAREAARRIRLSGLSPAERGTVERVIKLLTTARDSDSDAERATAYARARSELAKLDRAGVLHLPHPAQAALDAAARGVLPA